VPTKFEGLSAIRVRCSALQEIGEAIGLFVVFFQGKPHLAIFIRPQSLRNCSKGPSLADATFSAALGMGVSWLVRRRSSPTGYSVFAENNLGNEGGNQIVTLVKDLAKVKAAG
jgi:uncharacterized protein (TIGR03382 family)